ncbi:hypothetical protein V9K67_21335 [Paraflavisolibacter sp. H34]|uniref:hypothetical protein n=1 Tax=Huijunlia imazamoxiresistens TaxID=3127457 RepID=UPI00301717CE
MRFKIDLPYGSLRYVFQVEQGKPLKGFELFTLTAGDKKVVLQSNRPMLLAKGLKRKPIFWKVVEGEVKDQRALEEVIQAIEKHLKEQVQGSRGDHAVKKENSRQPTLSRSRKQLVKTAPSIPWSERAGKS